MKIKKGKTRKRKSKFILNRPHHNRDGRRSKKSLSYLIPLNKIAKELNIKLK